MDCEESVFFCSFFNVIIPKNFENLCVFLGFLLRPMCTCPKNPISFMHWIPFFSFCLISQLTFSQSQVPNPVNYLSVSLSPNFSLIGLSPVCVLFVYTLFIILYGACIVQEEAPNIVWCLVFHWLPCILLIEGKILFS